MSIFDNFMKQIFENTDFLEDCFIEGISYKVIVSALTGGVVFTDSGEENDVNFTLDMKLPLVRMPKRNDKVRFRNNWYKISMVETDSANTSIKLYLVALSKGI
jgi:hypothetical protein